MEELIVEHLACNDETLTVFDLSSFVMLKLFEVGDYSFTYVNEVKLIGVHALERVLIGKHCFRKSDKRDPDRHFYLKDCERLKELKIGCHSFSDFTVCVIANVSSLEVIEMGELNELSFDIICASLELNEVSYNFQYASLELKSDCDGMK